jgi:hypothetical protein
MTGETMYLVTKPTMCRTETTEASVQTVDASVPERNEMTD